MRKKMQPSDHHSAVQAYVTIIKMRLDSCPDDGSDWRTIALQLRRAASSASAIAKAYDEADAEIAARKSKGQLAKVDKGAGHTVKQLASTVPGGATTETDHGAALFVLDYRFGGDYRPGIVILNDDPDAFTADDFALVVAAKEESLT